MSLLSSARSSENWRDVDSELLPNRLVNPKLLKTVLGPYSMRSSCNHPAARMTPLRLSSTIFPNNVDSVKVFFHVSVQILFGFSTFVSLIFVPGTVGFSAFSSSSTKNIDQRVGIIQWVMEYLLREYKISWILLKD
jgi:hypothetical protein